MTAYRPPPIPERLRQASQERGAARVAGACLDWGARYLLGLPKTVIAGSSTFTFALDGEQFPYFAHRYHYTWLNERAVEVPIVKRALEVAPGPRVLEIGNVLGHYFDVRHVVVDRYEQAIGVRNLDLFELSPEEPWDLIVSISTLEHVGLDEFPQDPDRALAAVGHLRSVLAPGGRLLATVPCGQNPALDQAIRDGRAGFDRVRALRRVTPANRWQQVPIEEVWDADADYDFLLHTAHGLLICELAAG